MRILLDTHVWLWTLVSPSKISARGLDALEDPSNELLLSAASSWELAVKYRIGKLPLPEPPDEFVPKRLVRDGIIPLSVDHHHALAVHDLPEHHRDPFDRLLIVQARMLGLTLFTADRQLKTYDVDLFLVQ